MSRHFARGMATMVLFVFFVFFAFISIALLIVTGTFLVAENKWEPNWRSSILAFGISLITLGGAYTLCGEIFYLGYPSIDPARISTEHIYTIPFKETRLDTEGKVTGLEMILEDEDGERQYFLIDPNVYFIFTDTTDFPEKFILRKQSNNTFLVYEVK